METAVVETESEVLVQNSDGNDVAVIVLLVKNPAFVGVAKPYESKILGKSMKDWVLNAAQDFTCVSVPYNLDDDVVSVIKPFIPKAKYTAVLFSDAPLLTRITLNEVIDYVKIKGVSVCKLTRGYVFETNFLKNAETLYSAEPHYFDEEDFITAYNNKQLAMIEDIMKNRILSFHMKNGVRILDLSSVTIEADVTIEAGTIIYPNNRIYGTCYIGRNVELKPNNYINNSIIEDCSKLLCSVVENSKIPPNSKIGPYEKIIH